MNWQELYALAERGDKPWCQERAAAMIAISEQFAAGNISLSERDELMRDMLRMDTIDHEADDIELKTALVTAIFVASKALG